MISKPPFVAGILLTGLVGCASVPRDAGFGEVQKVAAERTASQVRWNRNGPPDDETGEIVRGLLHEELTADRAVQIALFNNFYLQATFEQLGIARGELVQAGLLSNPVFFAQVRFPKKTPLEFDLSQNFIDLLLLPLRKRIAEARFEETRLRVSHEMLKLVSETRAAFYRAAAAEHVLEMRRNLVEAADAAAMLAERMREAGNKSDLESAQEQSRAQRLRLELAQAEAEALEQREELNELLGLWGTDIQWRLSTKLAELPEPEIEAAGLESLAISQRLDLAAARKEIEALAQSMKLDPIAAVIPQLNVAGHFEREPEGTGTAGPGLEVPLPIFNQGQGVAAVAAARLRQSQNRYVALAVTIRSEVRRYRNRMLMARSRAEYHAKVVLPLRQRIVEQAQLQYNAMQIGPRQLLEAKEHELEAAKDYVESLRDYWVARSELERAAGGRLAPAGVDAKGSAHGAADNVPVMHGDH